MSRFEPYLGIVAALLLGAFLSVFSGSVTVERTASTVTSSSSISIEPDLALPKLEFPDLVPDTPIEALTTVPKKVAWLVPETTSAPAPAPTPVSIPVLSQQSINESLDASASALRSALVNIICYAPAGSGLHSISGSGVFIDQKGIILN